MTTKLNQIVEAAKAGALHPKHIHVHKDGKGFTIHSRGKDVHPHIKHGMNVSSGDLDDFRQMGYKVKETKKPLSEEAVITESTHKNAYDANKADGGAYDVHTSAEHHVMQGSEDSKQGSHFIGKHTVGGRTEYSGTSLPAGRRMDHRAVASLVAKQNPHLHKDTVKHIASHAAHSMANDHNENVG